MEGEEHAQLPVVLEPVLVAGGPSALEVGTPAGGDELDGGVAGDVAAAVGVHGLEQADGVCDLARRDAGGKAEGAENLWGEGADMREPGLHQLQVPTVTRWAFVVAACRPSQALGAQPPHCGTDGGVVEGIVQDDVEDVVEQHKALHVGLDSFAFALGELVAGVAVGTGQCHVEHAHRLVDDLDVGGRQRGEKDGVAALWGHQAQRSGGGAPGHGGQLAATFGWDGAQVQAVGS